MTCSKSVKKYDLFKVSKITTELRVVGNGATQGTFLKVQFVIFRCQKYVKKGT